MYDTLVHLINADIFLLDSFHKTQCSKNFREIFLTVKNLKINIGDSDSPSVGESFESGHFVF